MWLTRKYGPELKAALIEYRRTLGSEAGRTDPNTMAQVATGPHLLNLVKTKCDACPSFQIARSVDVEIIRVLDYSLDYSRVAARVEWGWHKVSAATGEPIGPCHAQAYDQIFIMRYEDKKWKVADGESFAHSVVDQRILELKHCGA
jgi:hypothetical protein